MRQKSSNKFKLFHDLMPNKVRRILLISTPYEAWIMEEDCRLSEQIVHEYSGLNLSQPPRLTWASSMEEAIVYLSEKSFDFVIAISPSVDLKAFQLCSEIKKHKAEMPVVLLTHQEVVHTAQSVAGHRASSVDHIFFWSGQADILLAIIKCIEDRYNVTNDIECADVRVILFIEDSPFYLSSVLPVLYKELVAETLAVIDDGLNEEHMLLMMRARPKILVAHCYEHAMEIYESYKSNILGVVSDVRFPRDGKLDGKAGIDLLQHIKNERFDIPMLLASSERHNAELASRIPALFIDKNSTTLHDKVRSFFVNNLGFGNFIFKKPDGAILGHAEDLRELELQLESIPLDSFHYHCQNNDFSRWLFSLAEVELAAQVRLLTDSDFESLEVHHEHLLKLIKDLRRHRQKGVIVNFDKKRFAPDTEFLKIGKGSLGGKARGLAFFSAMLHQHADILSKYESVSIEVPQSLVLTTECFDEFVKSNSLGELLFEEMPDEVIADFFRNSVVPEPFASDLSKFLEHIHYPLAVRSSSLLEDAQFKSYAGLYHTYIVANDHEDHQCRFHQLLNAIKLVYASTYFRAPKMFTERVGNNTQNEKMAVLIQCAVGTGYDKFYYPAVSGVAQSRNYYPFAKIKTEDGMANIALGLGKAVMEGETTLRFSPKHPQVLPQRTVVDDILKGSQRKFYALKLGDTTCCKEISDRNTLEQRDVSDADKEFPVQCLSSTYDPQEHRIRDISGPEGYKIVTFASLLKHKIIPFPEIIDTLLELGQQKLGCSVEIEFAVDFTEGSGTEARFSVLQIRPMSAREEMLDVDITEDDYQQAFCVSQSGLGNTINTDMADIIYIKPSSYDPANNRQIVQEINVINKNLVQEDRKYILIGPGRWGSSDHWLGIPVGWEDISGVGGIVETVHEKIHAEPSQGSHFFHNITTLGINYLSVDGKGASFVDWEWLENASLIDETSNIAHVRTSNAFVVKVDGRTRSSVILKG